MAEHSRISLVFPEWKRIALFISVVGTAVVTILSIIIVTTSYLYWKPRNQLAQSFDLQKLERANADQDRVRLEEISSHFINALLSAEDPNFYTHNGIDYKRIRSAVWKNMRKSDISEGASTITGNLVRLAFAEELKQRLPSPLVNICLIQRVEDKLDKEQILELYSNRIYFGSGYYGIRAAAGGYFGKSPKSLSVSESAALAGMIRNPLYRSPRLYPESCRMTRDSILTLMQTYGYIDLETLKIAKRNPVVAVSEPGNRK